MVNERARTLDGRAGGAPGRSQRDPPSDAALPGPAAAEVGLDHAGGSRPDRAARRQRAAVVEHVLTVQVDGTRGSALATLRHRFIQPDVATPKPAWGVQARLDQDFPADWVAP